jgi:microcin C transport system ATP-binding protein
LFISHDLKVVRAISHRLLVMRHGQVVEAGDTEQLFTAPAHDYTRQLIDAAFSQHRKQAVAH